jgi:hypothetical protein
MKRFEQTIAIFSSFSLNERVMREREREREIEEQTGR